MQKLKLIASSAMIALSLFGGALTASAASSNLPTNLGLDQTYFGQTGLGQQALQTTIANLINVGISLLGIITLLIILYGGYLWMTAGGNEEQVGEAKKWIYSGIVGLIIILSAFALSNFIIGALVKATGGVTGTTP